MVVTGGFAHIWDTVEIELRGPEGGNPFVDVTLAATFRSGARELVAPGFYDGGGAYKIRFLAEAEGEWSYAVSSNASELDGAAGSFRVGSARPGRHGPVRVAGGFHFAYADGTPYKPFGTTCYAWTCQRPALEGETLGALRETAFNKLRMCVFPKWYDFNRDEPAAFPFERITRPGDAAAARAEGETSPGGAAPSFDFSRPNPAYFRHLEKRIADLGELGIEADLILFHPYDKWGFSSMGSAADDFYVSYIASRLAAFPNVWWALANEFDLFGSKGDADWERMGELLRSSDPWGHLRSIHNCVRFFDHSRPWVTHASVQRVDVYKTTESAREWRERWGKPVVVDECGYEGDINWGWGNLAGQELARRCWEGAVRGAYVGHGETYLNEAEELWWSKGGSLVGSSPERIRFLRDVLEDGPEEGIEPLDLGGGYWDLPVGGRAPDYYLFYFGSSQPRFREIDLPPEHRYAVDVLDTWNMSAESLPAPASGRTRVALPGRQYMAIRARRID